jgi:hypothetical protein
MGRFDQQLLSLPSTQSVVDATSSAAPRTVLQAAAADRIAVAAKIAKIFFIVRLLNRGYGTEQRAGLPIPSQCR